MASTVGFHGPCTTKTASFFMPVQKLKIGAPNSNNKLCFSNNYLSEKKCLKAMGQTVAGSVIPKKRYKKNKITYTFRRNGFNPYDVLKRPVITEAAMKMMEKSNTLVFNVDARADKPMIKEALDKIYDIQSLKINTLVRPDGTKKAYIKLTSDDAALEAAKKIGIF